jgi:hypothetical protein
VLDLIVAKALDKQPDGRYQSAAEFAADVRACLAQLPGRKGERSDAVEATWMESPPAAAVDVVLEGTQGATSAQATLGGAGLSATLAGQGLSLPLSRRFDSTEAFLQLTGPAADLKAAAAAKGNARLPLSLRIRAALGRERLEPAWPIFAGAVLVAMAFAFLVSYSP